MALSTTFNLRGLASVREVPVKIEIETTSQHYVWVIWFGNEPVASEANVATLTLQMPPGRYQLRLRFYGNAGTAAKAKVTSEGVTVERTASIAPGRNTAQLTRQFDVRG